MDRYKFGVGFSERNINHLLAHVDRSLRRHNITYMIDGGTLIGSMLHHGRIPWDDDFDIYIRAEDKDRAIDALTERATISGNKPVITIDSEYEIAMAAHDSYMKIWSKKIPHVKNNRKHSWPFVDIGLLEHNATHAWEKRIFDEEKYAGHIYPLSILYPTVRRPFGELTLSAPQHSEEFLNLRFGTFWREKCVIANYDHRLEKVLDPAVGDGNELIVYPCAAIPNLPLYQI